MCFIFMVHVALGTFSGLLETRDEERERGKGWNGRAKDDRVVVVVGGGPLPSMHQSKWEKVECSHWLTIC